MPEERCSRNILDQIPPEKRMKGRPRRSCCNDIDEAMAATDLEEEIAYDSDGGGRNLSVIYSNVFLILTSQWNCPKVNNICSQKSDCIILSIKKISFEFELYAK